jgi:hypothetical protein
MPRFRDGSIFSRSRPASLSGSQRAKRSTRRLRKAELAMLRHEALEQRALMAIDFFTQPANGVVAGGWVTVIASEGDDVHAQQVATVPQSLLVADNSSFLGGSFISNINQYQTVYVTNGARVNTVSQTSGGYPFYFNGSDVTGFVLPTGDVDNTNESVFCRFSNGVGGSWEFTAPAGSNLFFDFSGPVTLRDLTGGAGSGPQPQSAFIQLRQTDANEGQAVLFVDWDTASTDSASGGMDATSPPRIDFISYDSEPGFGTFGVVSASNVSATSNPTPSFPLPVGITAIGEIVPGAIIGVVDIPQFGVSFQFVPETLEPFSSGIVDLAFRRVGTNNAFASAVQFGPTDYSRVLTGFINLGSGTIFLQTFNAELQSFNRSIDPLQEVGPLLVSADYARFEQPTTAADFTLFAGQTFSRALAVDLLAPGSTIAIQSPVIGADFIDLRASNVRLDAPTSSDTGIKIGASLHGIAFNPTTTPFQNFSILAGENALVTPGNQTGVFIAGTPIALVPSGGTAVIRRVVSATFDGTDTTVTLNAPIDLVSTSGDVYLTDAITAEQALFNAAVAADFFDIRLAEDPNTPAVERSKLFVSTTGSLSGSLPAGAASSLSLADSVFAQVETGDVLVEGKIVAINQSYLLQSAQAGPVGELHKGPYYFTTESLISGGKTGLLQGDVVAITLGNDLPTVYDDTANGGSSAFNVVTLQTDINALRVRAADQKNDSQQVPFPYFLEVSEKNDLVVDAVAASSLPVEISSVGSMNFRATLTSANDVTLASTGGNLQLNAPLSTMFGKISLSGANLTVANSVRVFDGFSDDLVTDIILTATNGDLNLVGPISAVNKVELRQAGDAKVGKIYGDARVIADTVSFDATGSVAIGTDVRAVSGRAGGDVTITEVGDLFAEISLTTPSRVAITANGLDYGVLLDGAGNPVIGASGNVLPIPALQALVSDSSALTLSAPRGSILVEVPTSDTVTLGDKTALAANRAVAMSAAGSVFVRSTGGAIDVLDAPLAGRSAREVRLVATSDVGGVYDPRVPGTFPGTLTGTGTLTIDGITPRIRDTVLLVGQTSALQNGVYTVLDPGRPGSTWRIARLAEYDTTAEMPVQARFRVTDGTAGNIDRIFSVMSYANVLDTTPISVTAVPNRFGAYPVRVVSTGMLAATLAGGVIESKVSQQIPAALFDGVVPVVGDRVLVRLGIDPSSPTRTVDTQANGVYEVVDIGSGSSKWKLQRVAASEFDIATGGLVVADEGTLRGRATGNAYHVRFDSLGVAGMALADITTDITTNIGSDDFNDTVTFVVSTNGTTNDSAGSLGKMIQLSQRNVAVDPIDPSKPQQQALRFGNTVGGAIRLVQQLPQITKAITLNASLPRYQIGATSSVAPITIDGSTIRQLRNGAAPSSSTEINGFEVVGSGASGTVIAGLQMAGFSKGAAVKIDGTTTGVDGVMVNKMTFGLDALGRRVPNKVGIMSTGDVGGYTTLSNNIVLGSTVAGIQIQNAVGATDGVRLVGNEVGRSRFENKLGILVEGGSNRIGLAPAANSPSAVTGLRVSATEFSVPATFAGLKDLYVGLGVNAIDITPAVGSLVARIAAISLPDVVTGRTTITIVDGTINAGVTTLPAQFGAFAEFVADSDTILIPVGTLAGELFLGQTLSASLLPAATTIKAIDPVAGTITLSQAATQSGLRDVTFGPAARNAVRSNLTGIELARGANRLMATEVSNSVFDGVRVTGVDAGMTQRIGYEGVEGAGGRKTAKDLALATSNAIFSSGGYGINVTSSAITSSVRIQGNYLGTNTAGASSLPNRRGNISPEGGVGRTAAPALAPLVTNPTASVTYTFLAGTATVTGGTVTITWPGAEEHGLATGRKLFVKSLTSGGTTAAVGLPVTVTFATRNSVTVSLTAEEAVVLQGRLGGLTTGTLEIEFYGPASSLPQVDNRDFEGNLHGLLISGSGGSSGGSGGAGGVTPRPGTGRPIAPPVRRR